MIQVASKTSQGASGPHGMRLNDVFIVEMPVETGEKGHPLVPPENEIAKNDYLLPQHRFKPKPTPPIFTPGTALAEISVTPVSV